MMNPVNHKCHYINKPCKFYHRHNKNCIRYLTKGVPDTDNKTYCNSIEKWQD